MKQNPPTFPSRTNLNLISSEPDDKLQQRTIEPMNILPAMKSILAFTLSKLAGRNNLA
jgi:hypothetical protein